MSEHSEALVRIIIAIKEGEHVELDDVNEVLRLVRNLRARLERAERLNEEAAGLLRDWKAHGKTNLRTDRTDDWLSRFDAERKEGA